MATILAGIVIFSIAFPISSFGEERQKIKYCIIKDETMYFLDRFVENVIEYTEEYNKKDFPFEERKQIKSRWIESMLKALSEVYLIVETEKDCPAGMSIYNPNK